MIASFWTDKRGSRARLEKFWNVQGEEINALIRTGGNGGGKKSLNPCDLATDHVRGLV